jgi:uncharacterized protein YecE (DUF72 family)
VLHHRIFFQQYTKKLQGGKGCFLFKIKPFRTDAIRTKEFPIFVFMKFGKDPTFGELDLHLPPTPTETASLLQSKIQSTEKKVYVGCAKWGIPEWRGLLYPKGTKATDYLQHYSQYFNGIELNTTHYGNKTPETISKWASKVDDRFRFAPKFPQLISHILRLKNAHEPTLRFIDGMHGFGVKLGPSFLQLPPNFGPDQVEQLLHYFDQFPMGFEVALELRHEGWFSDSVLFESLCHVLQQKRIHLVITDTAGRRDVIHQRLTTPTAFIRFVGNNLHPSDYRRVDEWTTVLINWFRQGLEELHFYVHQEDEVNTPLLCRYFIDSLHQKKGDLAIQLPKIPSFGNQHALFN